MTEELEFQLTREDLERAIDHTCKRSEALAPARANQRWMGVFAMALGLGLLALLLFANPEAARGAAMVLAGIAAVFGLFMIPAGRSLAKGARAALASHDARLATGPTRVRWVDGGLLCESLYLATLHRPGSLDGVLESDDAVLLVRADRSIIVVPRAAFESPADATAFAARAESLTRGVTTPAPDAPELAGDLAYQSNAQHPPTTRPAAES